MTRSFTFWAILAALATTTQASTLQLWLSPDQFVPGTPGTALNAQTGDKLYLFAATDNTTWSEVTIDFAGASEIIFYDNFYATFLRWDASSNLYGSSISAQKGVACGLGSSYEAYGSYYRNGYYIVGELVVQDNVYITNHMVTKNGSQPGNDMVAFGDNTPIAGNAEVSLPNPIAIVHCPEPASLGLLSLAGLFIRRR